MARFIKAAVVYCPVCNERVEKGTYWPGYLYVNKTSGASFVSERGEAPPAEWIWEEQKPAPWADQAVVDPCGHRLTADQAHALGEDLKRQLEETP